MESIARPLRHLHEEAAWFARARELKLMHVRSDATLRGPALKLLMAQEQHADNHGLFFRFDDPASGAARGWAERAARLREAWPAKVAEIAPAGIALAPLGDPVRGVGAGDFAATLLAALGCLATPLTQLVVVLAPTEVDDGTAFRDEMTALLAAPELALVRWIVVEVDGAVLAPLVDRLGKRALGCMCRVDEQEQQQDLAALVGGAPDASGQSPAPPVLPPSAWRAPGAMPDVVAPPRPGGPRRPSDDQLRAAGLSPAFVDGGGAALKQLVLSAALALRRGKPADAVALQARAAELCAEMAMPREQILNLHVLGGYLLACQVRARAIEVYRRAGDLARAGAFTVLEAQSELALGMIEALRRHPGEAAAHYSEAGRLAETARIEALAIECWRMAGQLALDARLEAPAIECWKRALALAEPLAPAAAQGTSAAEIARALAAVFRRRGQTAQAGALEQRALDIDRGAEPVGDSKAAAS